MAAGPDGSDIIISALFAYAPCYCYVFTDLRNTSSMKLSQVVVLLVLTFLFE